MRSFCVEQWHSQAVPTESPFEQRDFRMQLHSNRIKDSPNRQSSSNSSPVLPFSTPHHLQLSALLLLSMASSSTPAATGSYARSFKSLNRCLDQLPKDVDTNPTDVREWGEEFADLLVSPDRPIHNILY